MNVRNPEKHMELMEDVLSYILHHLDDKINIENVAAMYHYNPVHFARIFLEYFEYPFSRYIMMLRMRKCAQTILTTRTLSGVGSTYGYATSASFSKAFRHEFGISPREFLKKAYLPPDMPERKNLHGIPISLAYQSLPEFSVGAYQIPEKKRKGWICIRPSEIGEEEDLPCYGLWYHDEKMSSFYLYGPELLKGQRKKKAMKRIRIRPADYAVFSFSRDGMDVEEITEFTGYLGRYIYREWMMVNGKISNSNGWTFAGFGPDQVSIYIPIARGMYGHDTIDEANWQVAGWCRYIDEHIEEELSVKDLAGLWRYSEQNFRMIFEMYYGQDPEEYIRKKRFYLAASALHKGSEAGMVMKKYHFHGQEDFDRIFLEEFGRLPDDFKKLDTSPVDLIEYYQHYKKSVHIKFRQILPIRAAVRLLDREKNDILDDIPETASYWFTHDFDCLKGTAYAMDEKEKPSRIFIWKDEPAIIDGEAVYDYYLGPVVKKRAGIPEGMEELVISGGHYAVFRTMNASDKDDLAETYRMLTRIAFGGWIHECRYRVDYSRPTFINYKRQKLFFYVPLLL